jgi:hypothetical protein
MDRCRSSASNANLGNVNLQNLSMPKSLINPSIREVRWLNNPLLTDGLGRR